jgi:hypothetical protein
VEEQKLTRDFSSSSTTDDNKQCSKVVNVDNVKKGLKNDDEGFVDK